MANTSRVTQRYYEDERGVESILTSPAMKAVLLAVVTEGKKHAESIAPRRTGDYASKFDTSVDERVDTGGKYPGRKRAQASLENTSEHALAVEFGTEPSISAGVYHPGSKAHRTLGKTQAAMRAAARGST